MGRKLGFSNGAAAQVYDNLSRGAKLTGGNDGKIRVGCKEVLDVGDAASYGRDASSELVNALMGKQTPIFEGYDVFGNVFKFGHHVRRNEERTPWPTPLHDVDG